MCVKGNIGWSVWKSCFCLFAGRGEEMDDVTAAVSGFGFSSSASPSFFVFMFFSTCFWGDLVSELSISSAEPHPQQKKGLPILLQVYVNNTPSWFLIHTWVIVGTMRSYSRYCELRWLVSLSCKFSFSINICKNFRVQLNVLSVHLEKSTRIHVAKKTVG